ncbi:PREDICTED: 30S ribosomal protein S17-like [Acropora digitifera]|uniref:30S ribosomal protein S17-like n=1 Tax=Acropora digitifera TaxID=70779 RepID=UPI00077A5DD5|nr:PREDICTED: 30S ribosomal protein S17-like [Acropora digitifera]
MMAQFVGTVIGTKMDKTAKVLVTRMVLYRKLRKYFNERKVYFAHDETNECTRGDLVIIKECRKLSKNKAFTVSEIVERAPKVIDPETGLVHIQDNRE